jgi:hypothetical protein
MDGSENRKVPANDCQLDGMFKADHGRPLASVASAHTAGYEDEGFWLHSSLRSGSAFNDRPMEDEHGRRQSHVHYETR